MICRHLINGLSHVDVLHLGKALHDDLNVFDVHVYREERKKYHLHRETLRAQPTKHITIIIDGMDQSKTNIPALVHTKGWLECGHDS